MKNIRFYEEFSNKRKGISKGTVVAIDTDWRLETGLFDNKGRIYEAIASVFDEPNSSVCGTTVHELYLRDSCKRISEARALEIHPKLIDYLKDGD